MDEKKKINWGDACILIARVSTPEQVLEEGASPQISDLRKYAKEELGFKRFKEINTIESGFLKTDIKVGWNIVANFIENNPDYRTIIVTEMSRLSRVKEILAYIQNYLEEKKVQLIIKDLGGFRLFNEYGEVDIGHDIIFSLYASLASMEMKQKRERFERAYKEYKRKGYSIGGKELFGYTRVADPNYMNKKKYKINEIEAAEIRQIFIWYCYGINNDLSQTSISRITTECQSRGFSKYLCIRRNVNKALKEEAYTGFKITKNKSKNAEYFNYKNLDKPKYVEATHFECTYPRIIEDSLFEAVQQRMKDSNMRLDGEGKVDKSSKHTTILAKLITCQFCGSFFLADYRMSKGLKKFSYRCGGARGMKGIRKCEYPQFMSMRILDSAIWSFLKEKVENILQGQENSKSEKNRELVIQKISNLEDSLKDYDREYKDAEMFYTNHRRINAELALQEYQKRCDKIESSFNHTQREIQKLKHTLELFSSKEIKKVEKELSENISTIENSKFLLYDYVHLLIKSIEPLHNNLKELILRVTALDNIQDALSMVEEGSGGMPLVKAEKNDGVYYILIKKSTTKKFEMRVIDDCLLKWNETSQLFEDSEYKYSFKDIFSIDLSHPNETPLALSISEPTITYLDCYEEDIPNKPQLVSERIELISEENEATPPTS